MNNAFVCERITSLRMKKGVSEYKMSYDLGHSRGYINNISSGKSLPSLTELFAVCDYFGITPAEFFGEGVEDPKLSRELSELVSQLSCEDQLLIKSLAERLLQKQKSTERKNLSVLFCHSSYEIRCYALFPFGERQSRIAPRFDGF